MLDRVFGNRYRLVEKIGIGGMAEVYKSTDEVLGRTVAVKVMLPQYAADATFAARFKQEAQSAANLQSPYIVNIYDWGQDSADGTYYIVMEYVRGTDLKTAINQRGAINQRKAAEIGSQVCAALSVAHGYDIIHRDIKPHNIMVQPDGNTKVMDFGIARASGSSMTQTGSVLGTAYYISPEQAQGKAMGPATDLYSLGVVLYETTTGQVPFDASDAVAVALKQVNETPIPPRQINPEIDPELEAIIMRALEKDPRDRYATADQMRVALNNYLAGRPIDTDVDPSAAQTRVIGAALPVINHGGAQPPTHTAVMPSAMVGAGGQPISARSAARAAEEEKRKRRNRLIAIGIIATVAALAIIITIVFAVLNSGGEKVQVPDLVDLTREQAEAELTALGLSIGDIRLEASADKAEGLIISSDPSERTAVPVGTKVNLVISSGPEPPKKVKVPDLRGKTLTEAKQELEKLKLVPEKGEDRFDPDIPAGSVCAQDIPAGTELDEGQKVTYFPSKGKEQLKIPIVVGLTEADAKSELEKAGFICVIGASDHNDDYAEGFVYYQKPLGDNTAAAGTEVTISVSKGPKPPEKVTVPADLYGKTEAEAKSLIESAGLVMARQDQILAAGDTDNVGRVVNVTPNVGTKVDMGSTVTVLIGKAAETTNPPTTNPGANQG